MAIHDLTFTDWDNYTDGDGNAFTLDWTDVAAMTRQFPYPYIEAIRQAVNERFSVTNMQTSRDLDVDPLDSMVLSGAWAETVLKMAIRYVRCHTSNNWSGIYTNPQRSATFREEASTWLRPASFTTLNDVTYPYLDNIESNVYVSGTYGSLVSRDVDVWATRQGILLDDALITDPTFRDWWLSKKNASIENNLLFSFAEVIFNLKKMLSLLTSCCMYARYTSDVRWTGNWVERKEGNAGGGGGTEALFDASVALFNAASWSRVTGLSWGWLVSHMCRDEIYPTNGFRVFRERTNVDFDLGGDCNREVEVALQTTYDYAGDERLPYYQPSDFSVTSSNLVDPVTGIMARDYYNASLAGPTLTHTLGDYGNSTVAWDSTISKWGWNALGFMILQNFDVTDGFTFR